jgi:hypothetical protein
MKKLGVVFLAVYMGSSLILMYDYVKYKREMTEYHEKLELQVAQAMAMMNISMADILIRIHPEREDMILDRNIFLRERGAE